MKKMMHYYHSKNTAVRCMRQMWCITKKKKKIKNQHVTPALKIKAYSHVIRLHHAFVFRWKNKEQCNIYHRDSLQNRWHLGYLIWRISYRLLPSIFSPSSISALRCSLPALLCQNNMEVHKDTHAWELIWLVQNLQGAKESTHGEVCTIDFWRAWVSGPTLFAHSGSPTHSRTYTFF